MIVDLFPTSILKTMLEKNIIAKAVPVVGNKNMEYLMILWKDYVETDLEISCGLCYKRILDNFKSLQPLFITKVKGENLIDDFN